MHRVDCYDYSPLGQARGTTLLNRACFLQVWDVASKKLKMDLPGHADEVYTVDWSPDGSSVASGGKDQVLRIWRQ